MDHSHRGQNDADEQSTKCIVEWDKSWHAFVDWGGIDVVKVRVTLGFRDSAR